MTDPSTSSRDQVGPTSRLAAAHAHDSEVLHCDLKPGNMIVTPDDRIKLLHSASRAGASIRKPRRAHYGTLPLHGARTAARR